MERKVIHKHEEIVQVKREYYLHAFIEIRFMKTVFSFIFFIVEISPDVVGELLSHSLVLLSVSMLVFSAKTHRKINLKKRTISVRKIK